MKPLTREEIGLRLFPDWPCTSGELQQWARDGGLDEVIALMQEAARAGARYASVYHTGEEDHDVARKAERAALGVSHRAAPQTQSKEETG